MSWELIFVIIVVVYLWHRFDSYGGGYSASSGRTPVPTVTPVSRLLERRPRLGQMPSVIAALRFFDADDPELKAAWAQKNLTSIDSLLNAGDQLNRTSWATLGNAHNEATTIADLGRQALAHALSRAEPLLIRHGIDYRLHEVAPSSLLAGDARVIVLKDHWTQRLNYAQGGANIAGRAAASGNWMVALAAGAATLVMTAINESKYLRQFAEMEGEIKAMTAAMKGDVAQIKAMIETQLIPRVDWMIRLVDEMERETAQLESAGGTAAGSLAGEAGLRLSLRVAEAKMLMQTKANP